VIISTLKTRLLPVVMIASTAVKIGLSALLVTVGLGALGITIGFTAFSAIASITLAIIVVPLLSTKTRTLHVIPILKTSKELLVASFATWIPSVVYTIGAHLGPIFVFGSEGAAKAGVYFMAFAIALAMSSVMQV